MDPLSRSAGEGQGEGDRGGQRSGVRLNIANGYPTQTFLNNLASAKLLQVP